MSLLVKRIPSSRAIVTVSADMAKVDLNTCRKELLARVPGVGKRLAQKIIAYRDKRAGFTSLEQLRNIEAVTEAKFDKIKDYLTVR